MRESLVEFDAVAYGARPHFRADRWVVMSSILLLALVGCVTQRVNVPTAPATTEADTRNDQYATAPAFREAPRNESNNGALVKDLYVQFAQATVSGATDTTGNLVDTIWTRAYGTKPISGTTVPFLDIPGPTLVFRPGEWLQINLHNQLNRAIDSLLGSYEANIPPNSQDDIERHVPDEINIPHNADNTNLHVHGMHVDPKQDNVTLLILPEDDDPSNYTPALQRLIPDINQWWRWSYGYRVPADHLPGTHWYHAHKHGATSTHVENGMAGTLVVRPRDADDEIIPGLWKSGHDRLMVLQEIANYGVQQGDAIHVASQSSRSDTRTTDWPDITVNGVHQPELTLAPGQTERWRFVTAGANHRTSSYLWVGQLAAPENIPQALRDTLAKIETYEDASKYLALDPSCPRLPDKFEVEIRKFDGVARLVALDGITLSKGIDVTYQRPVLLGAGNRADLIVQPSADATGRFYVAKNFDTAPPQYVLAENANYGYLFEGEAGYWRYQVLTTLCGGTAVVNGTGTPYSDNFIPYTEYSNESADPYKLGTNLTGFKKWWPKSVELDGSASGVDTTSLVPLLRGKPDGNGVKVAPISPDFRFDTSAIGWTLSGGAGLVDAQVLLTVKLAGAAANDWSVPSNARLSTLSPTGSGSNFEHGIPAYVSSIDDADIKGRQVIVFDKSGIEFNYGKTRIKQFTLNGRQFDLDDNVGNAEASELIGKPVPPVIFDPFVAGDTLGTYSFNGGKNFTNRVVVDGEPAAFFANPGYYVPIKLVTSDTVNYYTYDYAMTPAPPDYETITGLPEPRVPMATTAEEWLLVNNSSTFHPFHIHINPLFLTEVGQLNHDEKWEIKKLRPTDPLGYVLNNWWDVVIIPPHGYVKFRTWMNIPNQRPVEPSDPYSEIVVEENANVFGSWVYHCHILRHEDRGMMMVVNVKPKPE